ncbi:uncharacterized protein LOC126293594 [Schistocerca gregaria]|uniref:uncharacterized protein LOC126293594 n=1 Tax=Schistocerca gregaria TaxID=7010 RepID=UPI00211DC09A|nr:uncharacterized protein LOC126293594 [Schistocerca gregaria]
MVSENILADLLNRFLGDYVENLDQSQLQIGIFVGDDVLTDLILKPSVLHELNLAVKKPIRSNEVLYHDRNMLVPGGNAKQESVYYLPTRGHRKNAKAHAINVRSLTMKENVTSSLQMQLFIVIGGNPISC